MDTTYEKTEDGLLKMVQTTESERVYSRDELNRDRDQAVLERDALIRKIADIDLLLEKMDELGVTD